MYCRLLVVVSTKYSFPNFILLLTDNDLIDGLKIAPDPLGVTLIEVDVAEYPIPAFMILTSVILPSVKTGLKVAPFPVPLESITSISGIE